MKKNKKEQIKLTTGTCPLCGGSLVATFDVDGCVYIPMKDNKLGVLDLSRNFVEDCGGFSGYVCLGCGYNFEHEKDGYKRFRDYGRGYEPLFKHDCEKDIYLGSFDYCENYYNKTHTCRSYDAYICPIEPTIIARYGNEGEDYTSGIMGIEDPVLFHVFMLAKHNKKGNKILTEYFLKEKERYKLYLEDKKNEKKNRNRS